MVKIIKPLRLSVLNRPFRWCGKNHLGISILALADMGVTPQLRPEPELWQLAADELQVNGGVVDLAIPKAQAEFLATGYAFTRHQQDKTACAVRIEIDSLNKTLIVSGDRYWEGNSPSPPQPFEKVRVDWSRAFGGEGYADNPCGIGYRAVETDGYKRHYLPNIEATHGRLIAPHQQPVPAGFGPLDICWPRRFRLMGKRYDAAWLKQDFPGFARDTDWKVFNAASPDQWWPDRDCLPPQARWRIWNMHPEKPLQEGILPSWQARCFVNRQRGEEILFEEVALRATTVWFFPHREQMLLIWQGSHRINEDDAADILQLMPALEKQGATRSINHYRKVLNQRLDKERGALFAFREKDLMPEEVIGPWLDSNIEQSASPMRNNLKNKMKLLREQHRVRLSKSGMNIDELLPEYEEPELPSLDELPEFIEKMERKGEKMRAEAEQRKRDMEAKYPHLTHNDGHKLRGPEAMQCMEEMLTRHKSWLSEKKLAQSREALHKMYLLSVQHQPPARRLKPEQTQQVRQRVEQIYSQGGDFSGMDLTGADLSAMDLRGANFNKALLECADLSHCQLDKASFQEAILARAELHHTSLNGADLSGANLALAQCYHTDFSDACFQDTQLQQTLFDNCIFDRAVLKNALFRETFLTHSRFHQADLDCCIFMELTLPGLDFSGARLHKVTFLQSMLQQAIFASATLNSCSFVETQAEAADFSHAVWLTCAVALESSLNEANFSQATLKQSNLRQVLLQGADFTLAKLDNSDLSEADCRNACFRRASLAGSLCIRTDFRQADFSGANLISALLSKSRLEGANFSGANLFRADLSQALTSRETRLGGAYTQRIKILPERDGEIV